MPKSRTRSKAVYTPPPRAAKATVSPRWLAPTMVGAFLIGLEQAAGTEAEVVGKPAAAFFAAALAHLGADGAGTAMVGDDIETDVLAAQRQGLTGVLVKTGKYLPRTHQAASGTPDRVLDSFADLPALLEQQS